MKAVKYLIAAIVILLSSSSYAQYTGTSINNLNTSTPTENGSFMYEYNDAIREIKTVLKNQYAIGSKTANYTTTASDSIIHIRSGTWTISLGTPTAYSSVGHTKSFIIKNTGTQTASVSPGSKKIEGTTTALLLAGSSSVYLWTDGNDWYKLKADTATIADNATNADQLDNQDSTYYTNATNLATGTVALALLPGTLTGKSADYLDDLDSTHFTNASNLDSGTIPLARIPSTLTGKDADTIDTIDSTSFVLTTGSYLNGWRVGNTAGTGTLGLAAGIGISLTPTYDSNGKGTVTVTAVGTATAGGWVDTGTQTISTSGYPVNCQGTVTLKPGFGIQGDIINSIGVAGTMATGTVRFVGSGAATVTASYNSNGLGTVTVAVDTNSYGFAYGTATQDVIEGNWTTVTYTTANNLKNMTFASSGSLTTTATGTFWVHSRVQIKESQGSAVIRCTKNGTEIPGSYAIGYYNVGDANTGSPLDTTCMVGLSANDWVSVQVAHNQTGHIQLITANGTSGVIPAPTNFVYKTLELIKLSD